MTKNMTFSEHLYTLGQRESFWLKHGCLPLDSSTDSAVDIQFIDKPPQQLLDELMMIFGKPIEIHLGLTINSLHKYINEHPLSRLIDD